MHSDRAKVDEMKLVDRLNRLDERTGVKRMNWIRLYPKTREAQLAFGIGCFVAAFLMIVIGVLTQNQFVSAPPMLLAILGYGSLDQALEGQSKVVAGIFYGLIMGLAAGVMLGPYPH